MPRRASIIRRLDAALAKLCADGLEARAVYLTTADWDSYNAALSKDYGTPLVCFRYADLQIFSGRRSVIHCEQGAEIPVPKRAP